MKQKPPLVLLFLLLSTFVFGQLEKGNIFMQASSSIGFSTEKHSYTQAGTTTEYSKSTHFGFGPKVGYFVIDNLPVGLAINVNANKTKYTGDSEEDINNNFTIGPFARYYFVPQDKLKPMAEISAGFGSSKDKYTYSGHTSESKYGIFKYSIGVGASYFVTDHVAFDLLIDYSSSKHKLKSETGQTKATSVEDRSEKFTGVGVNIGLVVTIP